MEDKIILDINNLYINFKNGSDIIRAVDGINITLYKGKTTTIIGESGSGKSQTVLAILGLTDGQPGIVSGSINFNYHNLLENIPLFKSTNKNEYKKLDKWFHNQQKIFKKIRGKEIALIFQDARASLIPYYSIKEQAWETWKKNNSNNEKLFLDRIFHLSKSLAFENIERILSSYPNQLSGGEAQRAYILLSLLGNPELVIADEPTSSLDPSTSKSIIRLLVDLSKEENFSLLIISHDLGQVLSISDSIYVFLKGSIVEELMIDDKDIILPKHPYTRFLLSMAEGKAFRELRVNKSIKRGNINTTIKGCPYANNCSLKYEKDEKFKSKCEELKPDLKKVHQGKVACWFYE